ncbi:MAG: hypothetical protein EP330_02890 [Deltaproteobacteria bacterium]|nr:MAG: hypothetical protein EP330_02890 [Deltaproteobacteria bacterium]
MKYASFALLLLAVGCNGSGPSEGREEIPFPVGLGSDAPEGEVSLIQVIDWYCDQETWRFEAQTDGLANILRLQVIDTGAWDGVTPDPPRSSTIEGGVWRESTTFFLFQEDPWLWEKTLVYNDNESQVANSSDSTLFQCGRRNDDNLAFSFQVLDATERVYDCALWGHMSEAWFVDNWGLNECLCFEPEENGGCGDHSAGGDSGM